MNRHSDGYTSRASFWSSLFASSKSPEATGGESTTPPSLEEAARHAQSPQADQRIPLGTDRQVSSIPRGSGENPHHQQADCSNWVYPSEQQLYNAMRKKGWQNVPEDSIPVVLQIHNNINERTWRQIQSWEGTKSLNLAKFEGRPRDMTPKAFFLSKLVRMYDPPFDRHDWYVEHGQNLQRYVIDYYYLPPARPDMPPVPYIDARPALDDPRGLYLRGSRFLQNAFPGITNYLKRQQEANGKTD